MIKNCLELFETDIWGGQKKKGSIPTRGSREGVYKHSACEGWASDISRPRTWTRMTTLCLHRHHPHDSRRLYTVFIGAD
jgi:hypothetical protein